MTPFWLLKEDMKFANSALAPLLTTPVTLNWASKLKIAARGAFILHTDREVCNCAWTAGKIGPTVDAGSSRRRQHVDSDPFPFASHILADLKIVQVEKNERRADINTIAAGRLQVSRYVVSAACSYLATSANIRFAGAKRPSGRGPTEDCYDRQAYDESRPMPAAVRDDGSYSRQQSALSHLLYLVCGLRRRSRDLTSRAPAQQRRLKGYCPCSRPPRPDTVASQDLPKYRDLRAANQRKSDATVIATNRVQQF
jgi:hypothetical protein